MKPSPSVFQKTLLRWFDQHGRKSLPWQINKTPYRVWVSEVMLQQTQVSTVIPYFERFMSSFPNLASLASAHEDDVLHHWAGLGYYSRARNLHRAAKLAMTQYAGQFPNTLADLQTLPGIGPSTSGAIMAIAFNQRAPILDGNVKRVFTRIFGIATPINDKATENILWQIADQYTPSERVADYTQAIMDLGATLCTRSQPDCARCPFSKDCVAYQQDMISVLPAKKVTKRIPTRIATFLIFKNNNRVLLLKRPSSGIWGGLFSLPEMEGEPVIDDIRTHITQRFKLASSSMQALTPFRHTFSHYHLLIHPVLVEIRTAPRRIMEDSQEIWYNLDQPESVGLPKPVQTILRGLT
jgi:A/G-specific adenine glycosylase